MPLVVGVSFRKVGKVYYFDPSEIDLHEGDFIIAETARGIEFGEVMMDVKDVPDEEIVPPLKKIVRRASAEDVKHEETNRAKERDAFCICQDKIHEHNLPMKLIDAEYCFDGTQVTFYFSADARVDFRELVKDLASALRSKVQLHQVGVRDEAKLLGGLGPCGRVLCCASFLNGFEPVSMKMAKEQSLFLNPLKFSGICGKLMCCLKYEYQTYRDAKLNLPPLGTIINLPEGSGRVVELDIIKESVTIQIEDATVIHYTLDELHSLKNPPECPGTHEGCGQCCGGKSDEEFEPESEQKIIAESAPTAAAEPDTSAAKPAETGKNAQEPRNSGNRRHLGRNRNASDTPRVPGHPHREAGSPQNTEGGTPKPEAKPNAEGQNTEGGHNTGDANRSRNRRRRKKPNSGQQ